MNQGLLSESTRDTVALLGLALGLIQTIGTLVTIWLSVVTKNDSLANQEGRTNRNLGPVILRSLKSTEKDILEFGRLALVIAVSTFLLSLMVSYLPDWVNDVTGAILMIAILVQDAFLVAVIVDFHESVMYELDSKTQRLLWMLLLGGIWLTVLFLCLYSWDAIANRENPFRDSGWFSRVLGAQGLVAMIFSGFLLLAVTAAAFDHLFNRYKNHTDQ